MPKLRSKLAKNLNNEEAAKCRSLTYREAGWMSEALSDARYSSSDEVHVYMIEEDGKLLSWALLDEVEPRSCFYTRKSERGKGYCTRLAKKIKKDCAPRKVFTESSSDQGRKLFNKIGFANHHNSEWD